MRELKNLVRNLNHLCKSLNYKYKINSGGCCYIAYLIAKHLDSLNIEYSLKIKDYNKRDIQEVKKEIKTKCINSSTKASISGANTCYHYYLHINGSGNINKGGSNFGFKTYKISNINHKDIYWIYKNGDWNERYDTFNNNYIKETLNKYFKKYDSLPKM